MKKISHLLAFSLVGIAATANNYTLKGVVADSKDSEPLPGALCSIFHKNDTAKAFIQFVTESDGTFLQDLPDDGTFLFRAEYMGYMPKIVEIDTENSQDCMDLGIIFLSEDATTLSDVTVTGRRPVIQANGEKVAYNMQEDPESQTSTVLEMLRKVPMVTVDGQDNIQVNGQSNFKIFINGKENPMFSANAKDILKVMPASSIKKIEVITEPGAKYDAEGVGGILNIVTEGASASVDGYSITLRGGLDNTSAEGSIYAIGQVGKITSSVNYSYDRSYNSRTQDVSVIRTLTGANPMTITMDGEQTNKHTFHSGTFDLAWEPNEKNLFNVSANLMLGLGNTPFNMVQTTRDGNGHVLSAIRQEQKSDWDWGNWSTSASYQHNFNKENHNIVLSYLYNHGVNKSYSYIVTEDLLSAGQSSSQINDTRNPTNEHTIQLDYTLPVNEHSTIETGAKGILRRNSSDGFTLSGVVGSLMPTDDDVSLKQFQDVGAVYGSYSGVFGKWSTKAGVRYEYTHMGVEFTKGAGEDFSTNLNDLVPNAALSYNFSPMSSFRLSYQMRISRPNVSQLNPYCDDSNPISVQYGNPDLTSERSNNISLTFSNFGQKGGMNIALNYFITNNSIGQYSYTRNGKIYTTYANTGRNQQAGLNAYFMFNPHRKMQISLNGSLMYKDFRFNEMNLSNHGWNSSAYINLNYTMPADIRVVAYGGLMKQGVTLQSSGMGAIHFYSLSLSKTFLGDRMQLTANASNFLGKMKVKMNSWTEDSRTDIKVDVPISSFGVSLSYRFGGTAKDVKKTSSRIDNDDLQKTSGGSTISGN